MNVGGYVRSASDRCLRGVGSLACESNGFGGGGVVWGNGGEEIKATRGGTPSPMPVIARPRWGYSLRRIEKKDFEQKYTVIFFLLRNCMRVESYRTLLCPQRTVKIGTESRFEEAPPTLFSYIVFPWRWYNDIFLPFCPKTQSSGKVPSYPARRPYLLPNSRWNGGLLLQRRVTHSSDPACVNSTSVTYRGRLHTLLLWLAPGSSG